MGCRIVHNKLLFNDSNEDSIRLQDILNVKLKSEDENLNQSSKAVLHIISYPLVKERRTRREIQIEYENIGEAKCVMERIQKAIQRRPPPHRINPSISNRVVVLINPFSGQQKAELAWKTTVQPVLDEADIDYDVIFTEYSGHATLIAQELDIDKYDAILVNSGDGLVSEVLCGFLMRKDNLRALKMPISHIPGGTSNALAASVLFACNEPFAPRSPSLLESSLMVPRPRFLPLRMFEVETEHNGIKSMFMSTNWGLIADIDIASERFRWAGMIRLHMEAVIRVAALPSNAKYHGKISYIPLGDKETSRKTMLKYDMDRKLFGVGHFDYDEIPQATSLEDVATEHFKNIDEALRGQQLVEVPPLSSPLSSEWTTVEGDFICVSLTTNSHLGSDLPYLPSTRFDEPFMYLMLMDWATMKSRLEIGLLFVTMDASKHLDYGCVQIIPVRACRVEPINNSGGYLAIDGEPCVNGSKFQVTPTKHCATIIGRDEVEREE